jgi:hypothetical protein
MVRPDGGGTVSITPGDVNAAAQAFAQSQAGTSNAWTTLQGALDGCAGMAGDDDPAREFDAQYSKGVTAAWAGLRAACLNYGGMARGLVQTANNFAKAEHHSTVGHAGTAPRFGPAAVFDDEFVPPPPSAIGPGSGSWLPGPLKKYWPDADTGKLRTAASAWRAAAGALDNAAWQADLAIESLDTSDDTARAIADTWGRVFSPGNDKTLVPGLEQTCRALADACDKYAQAVDNAHSQMKDALAEAGIAIGLTTALGVVLSVVTFGGSDAGAAAADTAEAAGILGPIMSGLVLTVSAMVGVAIPEELLAALGFAVASTPEIEEVEAETEDVEEAIAEVAESEGDVSTNFADTFDSSAGNASSRGIAYEDYVQEKLDGEPSFSIGGRQFDGKIPGDGTNPETWFEAKSGNYWNLADSDSTVLAKFKSSAGQQLQLATQNGAQFMVVSENPIPDSIASWLTSKGIPYVIVP